MLTVKFDSAVMFGFIITLVAIFDGVVIKTSAQPCSQSHLIRIYCEDYVVIKYPFWYDNGYPNYCGYPGFQVKCREDGTTVMNISNQLYSASSSYEFKRITLKDMDIDGQECPHPRRNISLQEFGSSLDYFYPVKYNWIIFYNCSSPPRFDNILEKFHLSCLDNSGRRSYAFPPSSSIPQLFKLYGKCEETLVAPTSNGANPISNNYTIEAKKGFILKWSAPSDDCHNCESSGGLCTYYNNNNHTKGNFRKCACGSDFSQEFDKTCPPEKGISQPKQQPLISPDFKSNHRQIGLSTRVKVLIGVFTGVGVLVLVLLLTYRRIFFSIYSYFITSQWRSNVVKGSSKNVEMYLQSCGHLTVERYKYSDIKKMTNSFKEPLGEGAYGRVFKGKLKRDGRLVAVKLLNESKGNGEDFLNEVATIGRTNHVNVVSLLGFCTDGTKRALVYELMPNGSLERFIYNEKTSSTPLGWEKLYQIALGIARGLEYLHRGCNTRILHFDIKPHNILLDQEFIPKISDFGLAKLCPTRESVVSMLVARGTIGYIAPEVCCRNFGGVSHKSDVYSYGMMVLEMIGGRKNIDATVENISEIYFPQWIYNHLVQEIKVEGSGEVFEDETTKKMIIVALWCIQTQPTDRPSISKVVEMLEGSAEELQMPPNPFRDFNSSSST